MAGLLDFLSSGARGLLSAPSQLGGLGLHELQQLGLLGPQQQPSPMQPAPAPFSGGIGNDFGAPQMPSSAPQSAPSAPAADGMLQQATVNGNRADPPPLPSSFLPPTIANVHPSWWQNLLSIRGDRSIADSLTAAKQGQLEPLTQQFNAARMNEVYNNLPDSQKGAFLSDPAGFVKNQQAIALEQAKPVTAELNQRIVIPDHSLSTNNAPGTVSLTPAGIGVNTATGLTGQTAPVVTTAGPGAVSGMVGAKGSGAPSAISGGRPSAPVWDPKTNSYLQTDAEGMLKDGPKGSFSPQTLLTELRSNPQFQDASESGKAFKAMVGNLGQPGGMKAYALRDTFARTINPKGAVRMGTIDAIKGSQGIPENVKGYFLNLKGDGDVSPQMAQYIVDAARPFVAANYQTATALSEHNKAIARSNGMDESQVSESLGAPPPQVHVALPPKAQLQVGHVYVTPRGPATWNGHGFVKYAQ